MPLVLQKPRLSRARLRAYGARMNRFADAWVPKFRRALAVELKREWIEAAEAITYRETTYVVSSLQPLWERRLYALELRLGLAMMPASYEFARDLWFGEREKSALILGKAEDEIPAIAFEHESLMELRMRPALERRLAETITVETRTTIKRIAHYMELYRDSGMTVAEQSLELRKMGLVTTKARADLLARTSTIWNHSEATSLAFREAGVETAEWLATEDDLTCPFCMDLDGLKFRLGEPILPAGSDLVVDEDNVLALPLAVDHPPLHPNCRCTLIPELESVTVEGLPELTEIGEPASGTWGPVDTWEAF